MDKLLPLLAIETSGEICSVAIMLGENSFVEMNYLQKHIHSKKIIDIIDTVLKTTGLEIKDLNAIAVSGGPGSFTGLRIGYSTAKGLAFGANKGIIPVPSFDAFALQISEYLIPGTEFIIANKAGSEEYYTGKFLFDDNGISVLQKTQSINKDVFHEFCGKTELIYGNVGKKKIFLTASSIAAWAYLFGWDLLTFDYDYIEPEYFGNPFIKKV